MTSQWGKLIRVTTFGESHGPAVGCVVDGIPAGIKIDLQKIQEFLARRRPGQSQVSSPRNEPDSIEVLSGLFEDKTIGSPITLMVRNQNKRPEDYNKTQSLFRPSHADYTYFKKYGQAQISGGGRASARETIGRVAAGALAKQVVLAKCKNIDIVSWVNQIGDIRCDISQRVFAEDVMRSEVRCPDLDKSERMVKAILEAKENGDTLGGIVKTQISGAPAGWGNPVFDKCEALLAQMMLSLPATKGFEIGSGFSAAKMTGLSHNDLFLKADNKGLNKKNTLRTKTNHSGGVQGGITNGMPIEFSVAFKPPSTVFQNQSTIAHDDSTTHYTPVGRHDPCVLPRAVAIVEAQAWLVMCELMLSQLIQEQFSNAH